MRDHTGCPLCVLTLAAVVSPVNSWSAPYAGAAASINSTADPVANPLITRGTLPSGPLAQSRFNRIDRSIHCPIGHKIARWIDGPTRNGALAHATAALGSGRPLFLAV